MLKRNMKLRIVYLVPFLLAISDVLFANNVSNSTTTNAPKTTPFISDFACDFEKGACGMHTTHGWTLRSGKTPSSNTGPDVDATFGTSSGHFLHHEASSYSYSRMNFTVANTRTKSCLKFALHAYGGNMGKLTISLSYMNNTKKNLWWTSGVNYGNRWMRMQTSLDYGGTMPDNIMVIFEVLTKNYQSDYALDDISVTNADCNNTLPPTKYPMTTKPINENFSCNFESGICGMRFSGSLVWKSGATPTIGTGPSVDATYGNISGYYVYHEASASPFSQMVLTLPNTQTKSCLKFALHAFGANMGKLTILLSYMNITNKVLWETSGMSYGNQWRRMQINLDYEGMVPNDITVSFETFSNDARSDYAYDDVSVLSGDCNGTLLPTKYPTTTNPYTRGNWTYPPTKYPNTTKYPYTTRNWTYPPTKFPGTTKHPNTTNFKCDFQFGLCGISIFGGWRRNSGSTSSYQTGPSVDATFGTSSGYYIYHEATSYPYSRMYFTVPNTRTKSCLKFALHAYGAQMGTLKISLSYNTTMKVLWQTSGVNYGDVWMRKQINMSYEGMASNLIMVTFEVFSSDYSSDYALDDISLSEAHCNSTLPPTIYPTTTKPFTKGNWTYPTTPTKYPNTTTTKNHTYTNFTSCNFESGFCGINTSRGWLLRSGPTPSINTGPSVDATYGTSLGHYIYHEASSYTYSRMNFIVANTRTKSCLKFALHAYGARMGTLKISLSYMNNTNKVLWVTSGVNYGDKWMRKQINMDFEGMLQNHIMVIFEASSYDFQSDYALDDIYISSAECQSNFKCDFQYGLCGISISGGWIRKSGSTPSYQTGPSVDATFGTSSGYYIYHEASSYTYSRMYFTVPNTRTKSCLKFALHAYGARMGTLKISLSYNTTMKVLWQTSGVNYGNVWMRKQINMDYERMAPSSITVTFEVNSNNYESDYALDDISVSSGECDSTYRVLYPYGLHVGDRTNFGFVGGYSARKDQGFVYYLDNPFIGRGFISFVNTYPGHTYFPLPRDSYIAAYQRSYWFSSSQKVFHRYSTDRNLLEQISNDINNKGYNNTNNLKSSAPFVAQRALIVTWIERTIQFNQLKEDFVQLVLTDDGKDLYAVMNYEKMDGNHPAFVGFYEQNCAPHKVMNTSNSSILALTSTNSMEKGQHIFRLNDYSCMLQRMIDRSVLSSRFTHQYAYHETFIRTLRLNIPAFMTPIEGVFTEIVSNKSSLTAVYPVLVNNTMPGSNFTRDVYMTFFYVYPGFEHYSYRFFSQNMLVIHRNTVNPAKLQYGELIMRGVISQTQCIYHKFNVSMLKPPAIKINPVIRGYPKMVGYLDSTIAWLKNITKTGFTVCAKKVVLFSDESELKVFYVAVADPVGDIKETALVNLWVNNESPCSKIYLDNVYKQPPAVFVTAIGSNKNEDALTSWVGNVGKDYVEICTLVEHSSVTAPQVENYRLTHSMRKASIIVCGEIDKCSNVTCPEHLQCQLDKDGNPYCGCIQNCSIRGNETICASDFETYPSMCHLQRTFCQIYGNISHINVTNVHEGRCLTPRKQMGSTELYPTPELPGLFCQYIPLDPKNFIPVNLMPLNVFLTVSWRDSERNITDASASWSEDVTEVGFRGCVLVAGRKVTKDKPTLHWIVRQKEGTARGGIVHFSTWYTGSQCKVIYTSPHSSTYWEHTMVSVEHSISRSYKDAVTVWTEIRKISNWMYEFYVCARELQNFDGKHEGIKVHWMVSGFNFDEWYFYTLTFPRMYYNPFVPFTAQCLRTYSYRRHEINPVYMVTALIDQPEQIKTFSNVTYSKYDVSTWIKDETNTSLQVCQKSLQVLTYMPAVNAKVIFFRRFCDDDWVHLGGQCYKQYEMCMNNSMAVVKCQEMGGNLFQPVNKTQIFIFKERSLSSFIINRRLRNTGKWVPPLENPDWIVGHPTKADCAMVTPTGQFMSVDCGACQRFVCIKRTYY